MPSGGRPVAPRGGSLLRYCEAGVGPRGGRRRHLPEGAAVCHGHQPPYGDRGGTVFDQAVTQGIVRPSASFVDRNSLAGLVCMRRNGSCNAGKSVPRSGVDNACEVIAWLHEHSREETAIDGTSYWPPHCTLRLPLSFAASGHSPLPSSGTWKPPRGTASSWPPWCRLC